MIEVWLEHKIVGSHDDAFNFVQVTIEDRTHLVLFDSRGQPLEWYPHGSYVAASAASYHPETGERLEGIPCASFADDPGCRTCHPPVE